MTHVRDHGVERKAYERPNTVRTDELVAHVEGFVDSNPNTSVRALAREAGTSEFAMRQLVKEDLGMRSYTKQERPLLSDATRRKREERANALVNRLKGVDATKNQQQNGSIKLPNLVGMYRVAHEFLYT